MEVNYYKDNTLLENRIDIFYKNMDSEISGVMDFLNSYGFILGRKDDMKKKIYPNEILYIEVVERRCYAYLMEDVYQIDYNLKNFQSQFYKSGFIQIGKSMIVNVYHIDAMKADLYMRMQLEMDNKEVLILNRAYKKDFMVYLKKMKEMPNENN